MKKVPDDPRYNPDNYSPEEREKYFTKSGKPQYIKIDGSIPLIIPPFLEREERLARLRKEADELGYKLVAKRPYDDHLKPCPKCGAEGSGKEVSRREEYARVCRNCGYEVSVKAGDLFYYTVKWATVLKMMWNGTWNEKDHIRSVYRPGGSRYNLSRDFTVKDLLDGQLRWIPEDGGVYMILMGEDYTLKILERNVGRPLTSKGKNPDYNPDKLSKKAEKVYGTKKPYRTDVIYIGKADHSVGLRERIKQYISFRYDEPATPHDGGRAAWQLEDSENLIVHYEVVDKNKDPEDVEKEMLSKFKQRYGDYPLANWRL